MLSVVIPVYNINPTLTRLTKKCLDSLSGQYDQLVIVDDYSSEDTLWLKEYAGVYIRHEKNQGYTKSVNDGIKKASGNYICVVCTDTQLILGNLRDLCGSGYTFPMVHGKFKPLWDGAFYCFPKELGGLYDERFRIYFGDLDKFYQAYLNNIPLQRNGNVLIRHFESQTTKAAGLRNQAYENDRIVFESKYQKPFLSVYRELP